MKTALAALAPLAALASPCLAANVEFEGQSVTIEPGRAYEYELACKSGSLVSGGYVLDNVNRDKGPFSKIVVVANGPVPDGKWRVGFFNDGDAPALVDFRISILCE